ncbi:CUB domain-containing protein [Aphelenchoides avenae]|nr:CUB domain-containing protein [Aphelenchus avenae]
MKDHVPLVVATIAAVCQTLAFAVVSSDPRIVYMDGRHKWDVCLPGLKRTINAETGILISHHDYGTSPYGAQKNCLLTITVPVGYRIRLRVLDFNVNGDARRCEKDTLHVFDHEQTIDPKKLENMPSDERSPGPIRGQFCGKWRNASDLMTTSTHNALTLWWHTHKDLPSQHDGEGFRIIWSAFRERRSEREECRRPSEFQCQSDECIPISLGCNRYADCSDKSDLDQNRQVEHKCEHIPNDVFSRLTGPKKLLICLVVVLSILSFCLCVGLCIYRVMPPRNRNRKPVAHHPGPSTSASDSKTLCTNNSDIPSNPPLPPNFSPPQVPAHMAGAYSPRRVGHTPRFTTSSPHAASSSLATTSSSSASGGGPNGSGELIANLQPRMSIDGPAGGAVLTGVKVAPRPKVSSSGAPAGGGIPPAPPTSSVATTPASDYTYVRGNEQQQPPRHMLL